MAMPDAVVALESEYPSSLEGLVGKEVLCQGVLYPLRSLEAAAQEQYKAQLAEVQQQQQQQACTYAFMYTNVKYSGCCMHMGGWWCEGQQLQAQRAGARCCQYCRGMPLIMGGGWQAQAVSAQPGTPQARRAPGSTPGAWTVPISEMPSTKELMGQLDKYVSNNQASSGALPRPTACPRHVATVVMCLLAVRLVSDS